MSFNEQIELATQLLSCRRDSHTQKRVNKIYCCANIISHYYHSHIDDRKKFRDFFIIHKIFSCFNFF